MLPFNLFWKDVYLNRITSQINAVAYNPIDMKSFLERLENLAWGDAEVLGEIIKKHLEQTGRQIEEMEAAIGECDTENCTVFRIERAAAARPAA